MLIYCNAQRQKYAKVWTNTMYKKTHTSINFTFVFTSNVSTQKLLLWATIACLGHWFARLAEKGNVTVTMLNCNAILRLDGDCFASPSHS
jgi:hypothetical protein